MSTNAESDVDLQRAIQEAFDSVSGIGTDGIAVSVERGIVHLDGVVRDAAEDAAVRAATFRVHGVACVVDRLRAVTPH